MSEPRAKLSQAELEARCTEWLAYRAECFIRTGMDAVYWWAAAHDFDFHIAGLHLIDLPETVVQVGTVAIMIKAMDDTHVVPIVRLTPLSLQHLQFLSADPLEARQAALRAQHDEAESLLRAQVHRRVLVNIPPPGGADGTMH